MADEIPNKMKAARKQSLKVAAGVGQQQQPTAAAAAVSTGAPVNKRPVVVIAPPLVAVGRKRSAEEALGSVEAAAGQAALARSASLERECDSAASTRATMREEWPILIDLLTHANVQQRMRRRRAREITEEAAQLLSETAENYGGSGVRDASVLDAIIEEALDVSDTAASQYLEATRAPPPTYNESLYSSLGTMGPTCAPCWSLSEDVSQRQIVVPSRAQLVCRYERLTMALLAECLGEMILERARDNCGVCEPNEGCPYVHMAGYRAGLPNRVYTQRFDNAGCIVTRHFNVVLEAFLRRSLIPCFTRLVQILHDTKVATGQQPQTGRAGELYLVQFVSDWLLGTDWRDYMSRVQLESAVHTYVQRRSGVE